MDIFVETGLHLELASLLSKDEGVVYVEDHVEFWRKALTAELCTNVAFIKVGLKLFTAWFVLLVFWALKAKSRPTLLVLGVPRVGLLT